MITANVISLIANLMSTLGYLYLQKTDNVGVYTVVFLFFIKGLLFIDIASAIFDFIWISASIYGLIKSSKKK